MQLFYQPDTTAQDQIVKFDREESKHIAKVLRKNSGDHVYVTNGKGKLFQVEITFSTLNRVEGKIISTQSEPQRTVKLHLAVAPTKSNDRFEWFLEKAVEIGIDEITPIICERSERKHIKKTRFERIIQSAMKQSLRLSLPKINDAVSFKDFIPQADTSIGFKGIAHCEEFTKTPLKEIAAGKTDFILLIGPEGDFSISEIELAKHHGFHEISLSGSRLRTETAAIVACHTVSLLA
ncbi:16S rRNA (uracil(1498)-N(3))-methyltransferase [Gangjinia marincola]|uniref:Ribosomal RNA small subunit methyltransferase E n=1 Tax=Gangjinia marincola TaxID=578463 RepID=A0ABP3XNW4_9FLAO